MLVIVRREVPSDPDELTQLPGVSANGEFVIQAVWFGKPTLAVDIACIYRCPSPTGF